MIQRIKCGHEPFRITPKYFRSYHFDESRYGRCQQCRAEIKDNNFKKELAKRTNGEFTHKELYTDRRDKITFTHVECGRDFVHPPDMLLRYQRCEHCEYDRMIEEFKTHLLDKYGGRFEVLDTYKTGDELVDIKCTKCDTAIPRKVKSARYREIGCRGKGCSLIKTVGEFQDEVDEIYKGRYKVLKYFGANYKTTIQHSCGYKREIMPQSILNQKIGCPDCGDGTRMWTHKRYVEEVAHLGNGEYELLTKFKGTANYITMKHKVCGHVWDVIAVSFIRKNGHRCPQCMIGRSHNSIKIDNILSNTNLFYLNEYTIESCRNIRPLPFDFAIIKSKKLFLIEYDGEQHFREVGAWGGEEGLKVSQHRDQIKNQYCINNNISLVRVPYWESEQLEHVVKSILDYFELDIYDNADYKLVKKYLVDDTWDNEEYLKLHSE